MNSSQNEPLQSTPYFSLQKSSYINQGAWQGASFTHKNNIRRLGHASVIIDQYLIMIGGARNIFESGDANLVVLDMKKKTCIQVEISGREPSPLSGHSACYWKDNQIIVYGGESGFGGDDITEVGVITLSFTEDSLKAEWKTIETNTKIIRRYHSAHIYNNQMIVLGGLGEGGSPLTEIHILNLDDFTWTQPKIAGEPLKVDLLYPTSVLYGNEIFVSGVKEENGETSYVFSSLNLEAYTWKKLPQPEETPGASCKYAGMYEHQGKIYFAGRFSFSSKSRVILKSFDIDQGKWSSDFQSKHQDLILVKDVPFSLHVYDNQLVVLGGRDNPDCQRIDLFLLRLGSAEMQKEPIDD